MPPEALELETRRRLYQHIVAHPGKYLRELERDVGMAMGALEYHLDYLATAGLITVLQDANKRFFPNDMDRREKRILAILRQELPRRALLLVIQHGSCPKSQLLDELHVAPSTLNYHLRRLEDAGILEGGREGRDAVYRVPEQEAVLRLLVAYRASFLDRMVDAFLEGIEALHSRRTASQTP